MTDCAFRHTAEPKSATCLLGHMGSAAELLAAMGMKSHAIR